MKFEFRDGRIHHAGGHFAVDYPVVDARQIMTALLCFSTIWHFLEVNQPAIYSLTHPMEVYFGALMILAAAKLMRTRTSFV